MYFFSPKNENELKIWTKLVRRVFVDSSGKKKTLQKSKYTKISSNHFEYSRPVEAAPNTTLFLKGYDSDVKVAVKRKTQISRKEPPARKKILRKEPAFETKRSQPGKEQLQEISSNPESPTFSIFIKQVDWKNQLVQRLLMFLCYLVKLEMWTLIYQKPKKVR